jgi:group I intron endonuclease
MIEDKQYYVYITTNLINGKQYVGDHKINPKHSKYYIGSGHVLLKAFEKYGKDNFFKEILEWFDSREDSFKAQKKYIEYFNTLQPNGYNISPTGGAGISGWCAESTRKKLSDKLMGHPHFAPGYKHSKEVIERQKKSRRLNNKSTSQEFRSRPGYIARGYKHSPKQNLEKSIRQKGKPSHNKGMKIHTEESKRKLQLFFGKPVLQYDKNMNFIKEWPSSMSAAKALGVYKGTGPNSVANGKRKTWHGFIWVFKNKNNDK